MQSETQTLSDLSYRKCRISEHEIALSGCILDLLYNTMELSPS
jgi:hypothetical protein